MSFLQDAKVWKVMDESAHVSLSSAAFIPLFMEAFSACSNNLHGCEELCNLEASGQHDQIEVRLHSILADDTSLIELLDSRWHKVDGWAVQRF